MKTDRDTQFGGYNERGGCSEALSEVEEGPEPSSRVSIGIPSSQNSAPAALASELGAA